MWVFAGRGVEGREGSNHTKPPPLCTPTPASASPPWPSPLFHSFTSPSPPPPHLLQLLLLGPIVQPGHLSQHGRLSPPQLLTPLSLMRGDGGEQCEGGLGLCQHGQSHPFTLPLLSPTLQHLRILSPPRISHLPTLPPSHLHCTQLRSLLLQARGLQSRRLAADLQLRNHLAAPGERLLCLQDAVPLL